MVSPIFTACASNSSSPKVQLEGVWIANLGTVLGVNNTEERIEFYPKGKVTLSNLVSTYVGNYEVLDEDSISLEFTEQGLFGDSPKGVYTFTVEGSQLRLSNDISHKRRDYLREATYKERQSLVATQVAQRQQGIVPPGAPSNILGRWEVTSVNWITQHPTNDQFMGSKFEFTLDGRVTFAYSQITNGINSEKSYFVLGDNLLRIESSCTIGSVDGPEDFVMEINGDEMIVRRFLCGSDTTLRRIHVATASTSPIANSAPDESPHPQVNSYHQALLGTWQKQPPYVSATVVFRGDGTMATNWMYADPKGKILEEGHYTFLDDNHIQIEIPAGKNARTLELSINGDTLTLKDTLSRDAITFVYKRIG
jgi:hypothetical protein